MKLFSEEPWHVQNATNVRRMIAAAKRDSASAGSICKYFRPFIGKKVKVLISGTNQRNGIVPAGNVLCGIIKNVEPYGHILFEGGTVLKLNVTSTQWEVKETRFKTTLEGFDDNASVCGFISIEEIK